MREDRNYGECSNNLTVIEAFEEYERLAEVDFGSLYVDFINWYKCFLAGYIAGSQM